MRRGIAFIAVLGLAAAACGSGPSQAAIERNEAPSSTTTTEPPPQGVFTVVIENGKFTPAILEIDLNETWIVRWEHQDDPERTYILISSDRDENGDRIFESPELQAGDSFEFDFSTVPPKIYRYNTFIGNQRIPGMVDSSAEL